MLTDRHAIVAIDPERLTLLRADGVRGHFVRFFDAVGREVPMLHMASSGLVEWPDMMTEIELRPATVH